MTKTYAALTALIALMLTATAAAAAGLIETALSQAQVAVVGTIAAVIVGGLFGFFAGRVDARAKAALAKDPADRTLTDKLAIEADRRLDALDRAQLETIISNVLLSNVDKVASTIGLPPKAAADIFVDDFFAALRERNPGLAARLPIGAESVKDLIAAGIGKITAKDILAEALVKAGVPGVVARV